MLKLLVLLFPLSLSAETPCELRALVRDGAAVLPSGQTVIRTSGGRGFINPARSGPAMSFREESRQRAEALRNLPPYTQSEIEKTFAEVRDSLIEDISGGKTESELSADQRLIIGRLKALRIRKENCDGQGENRLAEMTIRICESAHRTPLTALVALIGHEIGHSVDLCNLSGQVHRCVRSGTRLDLASRASGAAAQSLREASQNGARHLLLTAREDENLGEPVRRLVSAGHLEVMDRGIPLERNPALAAYRCLEKTGHYPVLPAQADRTCGIQRYSEAGAQIWGARALAHYVAKNPSLSRADLLGAFDGVYPLRAKGAGEKEKDANAIYLSEPSLQRALGCRPSLEQNCQSFFRPSASVAPVASPELQETPTTR